MVYDFGMTIKQLRKQKGWSQQTLGRKIGVSKGAISTYERNVKIPSAEIIKTMAVTFHVSADYLLGLKKTDEYEIEDLTENQKEIIKTIIDEFRRSNR